MIGEYSDGFHEGYLAGMRDAAGSKRRRKEMCDLCRDSGLEEGDTLYKSSDWDGGIGFDYIRDIRFCPKCGRELGVQDNETPKEERNEEVHSGI